MGRAIEGILAKEPFENFCGLHFGGCMEKRLEPCSKRPAERCWVGLGDSSEDGENGLDLRV